MTRFRSCSASPLEPSLEAPDCAAERDPPLVRDPCEADLGEGLVWICPSLRAGPERIRPSTAQASVTSSSSAFWAWRRFSAWSQIRWRGP